MKLQILGKLSGQPKYNIKFCNVCIYISNFFNFFNFLLAAKSFSNHIFSLNLEVKILLMLLMFCNASFLLISGWFN